MPFLSRPRNCTLPTLCNLLQEHQLPMLVYQLPMPVYQLPMLIPMLVYQLPMLVYQLPMLVYQLPMLVYQLPMLVYQLPMLVYHISTPVLASSTLLICGVKLPFSFKLQLGFVSSSQVCSNWGSPPLDKSEINTQANHSFSNTTPWWHS